MPVTSSSDWFEKREWDGKHLHYFTVAETLRLTGLFDLKSESVYPVGNALPIKRVLPSLFCYEISFAFSKP